MEEHPGQPQGTEAERPLREWQKDTWVSPYPMMDNPFDEPEDAPELRELRSEELNNRSGEFWQTTTGGYQFGKTAETPAVSQAAKEKQAPEKSRRRLWITLASLGAALAVILILYYAVFAVRTILVVGNEHTSAEEIIRLSGIREGMPILALNAGEIERGVESSANLKFRYLDKQLPSTVVLRVQEREACCWMIWNGILYTMDKQRTLLFESEDLAAQPANLVRVDGLKIRSGTQVGQTLALENSEQQETFSALFLEMKVLGCTELIAEADLSNLSSLLLTTRDGFTIAMGTRSDIHAKLRAMLLTREELLKRDYRGGVINVTLPETPIYSPPET